MVLNKTIIAQIFDGAAETYDETGPAFFRLAGTELVKRMHLKAGEQVLDVATGAGACLPAAIASVAPNGLVAGVDLSTEILSRAQAQVDAANNLALARMDGEHLAFAARSFDAVTCAFALFFFTDVASAVSEMKRVCRPGGRVGISLFDRTSPPFDPGWPVLARKFREFGLGQRTPSPPAYTPAEFSTELERLGLPGAEISGEKRELVYSTEQDWWAFQLTVASRRTILALDPYTRVKLREEYFSELRPYWRADGLHVSVGVLYAIAPVL